MSAHSPGPWKWTGIGGEVNAADGSVVHDRHWSQAGENGELERAEADARIIAAAPELLALARYVAERGEGGAEMALALIARIEGGT